MGADRAAVPRRGIRGGGRKSEAETARGLSAFFAGSGRARPGGPRRRGRDSDFLRRPRLKYVRSVLSQPPRRCRFALQRDTRPPACTASPRPAGRSPSRRWVRSASSTATSAPARSTRSRSASTGRMPCRRLRENVLGVLSLVFWALTFVVTFKYLVVRHAGRQPRRGRDPGAHGAGGGPGASTAARPERVAPGARAVRGRAALRRRRDHAGHLGARRGRGPRRWPPRRFERLVVPLTVVILVGALPVPEARHRARWARCSGRSCCSGSPCIVAAGRLRHRRTTSRCCARSRPTYARRVLPPQRLARLPGAGRGGPRDHRRRGALRRHGPLRAAAHPRWPGSLVVMPALLLNYFGPGSAAAARSERGPEPLLPPGAHAGRSTRSSRSPPSRPSSPRRPSSPAPSP